MSQMTAQINFSDAREAMVVSQLNPSGVVNETVLDAYRAVPRELFVPADRQTVCYLDDDVIFANGRCLMEPLVHALMVEKAQILPTDKVLDIGGLTGYSAAILMKLAKSVVAVEEDPEALDAAKSIWLGLEMPGIMPVCAAPAAGCPAYAPYDVILINGAVVNVPQSLVDQLAPHGRLVCVETKTGTTVGQIRLYTKQGSQLSGLTIADASIPYLPGLLPTPTFVF